jgi:hypothetical protein
VRYYGDYSNRPQGARGAAEQYDDSPVSMVIDESPADTRRKANWARLIQKVYPDPPLPHSETLSLTYYPVPEIA